MRGKQSHSQAMTSPEVGVTDPHCSFSVTVPLVVGFQLRVVAEPAVKS